MTFDSFDRLEKLLYGLSKVNGYKVRKDVKTPKGVTPSPLISPALYKEGTTRSAKNVIEWSGWACIDVDDYATTFQQQVKVFGVYRYVCYSTASSTKEKPKFRVVFPLTANVQADDIPHFWFALNKEFGSVIDEQTKDVSRMFYVPAIYPDAFNFIFSNEGAEIDPAALMRKHEYIRKPKTVWDSVPDALKEQMLAHRKAKFTNTNIKWTSYRDCPFVTERMLNSYLTLGAGWYHKSYKMLCAIACRALARGYPIAAHEIESIFREIDAANGNWYLNRPILAEAERALEYALKITN